VQGGPIPARAATRAGPASLPPNRTAHSPGPAFRMGPQLEPASYEASRGTFGGLLGDRRGGRGGSRTRCSRSVLAGIRHARGRARPQRGIRPDCATGSLKLAQIVRGSDPVTGLTCASDEGSATSKYSITKRAWRRSVPVTSQRRGCRRPGPASDDSDRKWART
jgi:hypothetical protein